MKRKYSESWAKRVFSYARKYHELLEDPSGLERINDSKRNNVMSSLVALAKFLGCYREFRASLKSHGVSWSNSSSVDSFFRIMGNNNGDILEWLEDSVEALDDPVMTTFLKFALMSGLRKGEAIKSFNLIIELSDKGDLSSYFNEENETLEHFKYPDLFLRNTKNVFISAIPEPLIREIENCEQISYEMFRKRLYRRDMQVRLNELRDFWGTWMVNHGLIKEEVDLLQGRISKSIFVRHYWSPAIKELRDRVFTALDQLRPELA